MATRREVGVALAIFLIALAARLIFLFTSPDRDWPHSTFYEGDATLWVEWARAIDTGGVFEYDLPIHPPAIAYAIAYLYDGVRSSGFVGMKSLWCVMSAAACGLTYLACLVTTNRRIACIASLLLAFSFNQYLLATSLNNETPYVMLLPALVLCMQRAMARPTRWVIAVLGVLHGVAMLLRPEHPLLLGMFLLWMLVAKPPRVAGQQEPAMPARLPTRALSAAAVAFIALLTCLPWIVHANKATHRFNNLQVSDINFNLAPIEWTESARQFIADLPAYARTDLFGVLNHVMQTRGKESITADDARGYLLSEFNWIPRPLSGIVLISSQGPFSFALANHPACDGGFSRAAIAHPMRGNNPTFAFSFPPHNRVFVDGWRVGWDYISSDPAAWFRLVGRKFQRFADGVTCGFGAANLPLNRSGFREPVDIFVSDASFARIGQIGMLALVAAGLFVGVARRLPISLWLLIIVYKVIVTIAFYGYARQGASIAPVFFVLLAIASDALLLPLDRKIPRLMRRNALVAIVTCALLLVGDIVFARRGTLEQVVGNPVPRPELGTGAFQAFNRIEIR